MGNFFTDVIEPSPLFHSVDPVNDPALLFLPFRVKVEACLRDLTANGEDWRLQESYRSQELQQIYFDRGTTQLETVGVHHFGLASDLVRYLDGEPTWSGDYSVVGAAAAAQGLIWGGDWGRPDLHHSFRDFPHVQYVTVDQQAALFAGTWYPDDPTPPDTLVMDGSTICEIPLVDGTHLVPVRAWADFMGFELAGDPENGLTLDGGPVPGPITVQDGASFAPLRPLVEAAGLQVLSDANGQVVIGK